MNIGDQMLVTTDEWFYAHDGLAYRAAWGTVKGVRRDDEVLGIKTNARSTNWYLEIGNLMIAGCQIHYALKCDKPWMGNTLNDDSKEIVSRIYNADQ